MSRRDESKPPKVPDVQPDATADAAAATDAPAAGPEDELTALRREAAELRDKNLRLIADAQNAHKRAQREIQEARRFAAAEFARELLVVLDDLDRTLQAVQSAADAGAVGDGVRIACEHFLKVLRQWHVEPVEAPAGGAFDPALHEAILQQSSEEHPAGTILQEMARGYRMHERVLRPSRVIVSSGPAAEAGKE